MEEKNIIILRSVYGKVGQTIFITPVKDPRTGRFPDCVRRVNSNGDMILSDADRNLGHDYPLIAENRVFEIQDGTQLDLNDPWQNAEWECIKNSFIIAPSRDARDSHGNLLIDGEIADGKTRARYGKAELYVEAPGRETVKKVSKAQEIFNAQSFIFNDDRGAEGRVLAARLLGKNMKNAPDAEVTNFLLDLAQRNPKQIIEIYTGSDTGLRLLIIEAREKNIIIAKNKVFVYADDIVLGVTEDSVLAFLKDPKNKKILELIKRDTYPELAIAKEESGEEKPKVTKASSKK